MGIAGHISIVLADVIVGLIDGAYLLATCGVMLPIIAYSISGVLGGEGASIGT